MKTILKDESEFETTTQILENNYPEMLKAIKDDDYQLQYEDYDIFNEITDEKEVIGFYTIKQIDLYNTVLNELYILKSHRGNNISVNIFLDFFALPNTIFCIRNPNQNMIKVLIKNNLAKKLSNNIIHSYFPIISSTKEIYKNSRIKKFYKNPEKEDFVAGSFYDDELKCGIGISEDTFLARKEGTLILFEPRKDDLKKYNLRKKLKKVSPSFLYDEAVNIAEIVEEADTFFDETHDRLVELNSIENQPIPPNLTKEDVLKNIEKIDMAPECARIRLAYLSENPDKINGNLNMDLLPDKCPYCENEVLPFYEVCPVCAYPLLKNLSTDILSIDGDDRLFREVMGIIHENNWDENEIFNLQCLSGTYEYIKMTQDGIYLSIEQVDKSNKLKSGSVEKYALEHGYLKECSYDEYINLIENEYSKDELKAEAQYYGLKPKFRKKAIIKQIKETKKQSFKYLETEKGIDLYKNSEILEFYMDHLSTFLFCEFKKFMDEHDLPVEKAGDEFIQTEFEKGIKNKNWRVYKQLLKYRISRTDDPAENLKLSIQTLIFDVNYDDIDDPMELGCEPDTLMYLMQAFFESNEDTEEILEKAYDEFEVVELKHQKEKVHEILIEIENGEYLNQIRKMLV